MDPLVAIAHGTVLGAEHDGVLSFKGIPYAAPPVGEHRFAAPAPPTHWDWVRHASRFGHTAPKPPYPTPIAHLLAEPDHPGDDFLNLNVWTPSLDGRAPVLVWIHGGAFANGSGAVDTYDGAAFARDGIVCVTFNYRLGAEGFLLIDGAPANRGLLDQVAALRWVRENIGCFGGDPDRVTIAGESAGAMSVTTLLSMPATEGLFGRVIAQSGAGHHVMTSGTAKKVTAALADHLGVPPTVAGFASVSPPDLVAAQAELSGRIAREPDPVAWGEIAADSMAFEPCVDGDVLTTRPIDALTAGTRTGVDVLIGTNSDEFTLFLMPSGVADAVPVEALVLTATALGLDPDAALAAYHADRPGSTPGEVLAAILRDRTFWIPAIRVAEARSAHDADTHVYEFTWRTPLVNDRLGATHALELGFVFDTLGKPGTGLLAGPNPPQELADEMHRAWVEFVRSGDPGWPAYGADRTVRMFGGDAEHIADPRADLRELWDGIR
ncbi:carboxylesterase family protein [Rhodococcus olei]|uniref:Carboxylic ester hydrolase n=1 Tax=Rhodococcus olei TaxID=2161675 RepID=A0ABP8NV99_9NOCA